MTRTTEQSRELPPHPFPARMAPELATKALEGLAPGSLVLDPMCGSGTVLRAAQQKCHRAIGVDSDPLAVMIAKAWTTGISTDRLIQRAQQLVRKASAIDSSDIQLPWIDDDEETVAFIDYWFADEQKADLRKLAYLMQRSRGSVADSIRLVISRMIITKDAGASLARDVSHSRPHRVRTTNDFDVMNGLVKSARLMSKRLHVEKQPEASVRVGDARALRWIQDGTIDAVVTSSPYLNAIDYLRGHRLSLVWFGHSVAELRGIRATNIGSERERAPGQKIDSSAGAVFRSESDSQKVPPHFLRVLERFSFDIGRVMTEVYRVLRRDGKAVFVIGNSTRYGVAISNDLLVETMAKRVGFRMTDRTERQLDSSLRYLPPPEHQSDAALGKRMRAEVIMTLTKE